MSTCLPKMLRVKDWLLITGILVLVIGLTSLPLGQRVSPKASVSLFNQSASAGAFLSPGAVLLVLGLLVIGVSLLLPRK